MCSRTLLVFLFALKVSDPAAFAQTIAEAPDATAVTEATTVGDFVSVSGPRRRPALLLPFYYSISALQTADVVTTSMALPAGAREANPLVSAMGNDVALVTASKAAGMAATIAATEYLWKHGHRKLAVTSIVIAAALQAAVVINNVSVIQSQRAR